jgi:apolipoprotein N-acyltransferase
MSTISTTLAPDIGRDQAPARAGALADRVPAWALLALGALATMLTGPRFGAGALAWLAPVPYLLHARRARGWRPWLALGATLVAAFSLQLVPIATPPVPPLAVLGFGAPVAIGALVTLALSEILRRRAGEIVGIYGFAALTAVFDWAGYRLTELGVWSATANSQVGALALVQLASVAGLAGVGFLMSWFAAVVASLLGAPAPARRWRHALAALVALAAALVFGSVRLDATHGGGRTVSVGAVVTDLGLDEKGLPDAAALAANTDALFERTRLAAARGARLVVWNEVATVVPPDGEAALVERGRGEARRLGVDLVLAYGVLVSREPLLLDNKYVFLTSEGEVADTYRKHHPVPGEPSMRGSEPLRVIERPYARVAGAICYDYDFPALAREHARLGAELVVVPSSDWRGIDPVHTFMARVRAVEGGFSLVRATRWGASGAFDAYGRVRGWMQVTEPNERVMVASVPVGRVRTVYGAVGDAPVAVAGAFLVVAFGMAARRKGGAR